MEPGFSLRSVLINLSRLGIITVSSMLFSEILLWKSVKAQPIIPEPNSTNTQVNRRENRFDITGGTASNNSSNLFHSFTEFNLESGQVANFISSPEVENILTRVVGGNPSTINGLLQVVGGNSNLFFMNPSGVIFGSQASLNIPAAFTVTTATGIGFEQGYFNAVGDNNYSTLLGTPNTFQFAFDRSASIINAGKLQLQPGQNLTLLGGTIINTGDLIVPGGQITLAAVEEAGIIRLSQTGHLLNLEINSAAINLIENEVTIAPLSLPELLTGKSSQAALGVNVLADGTVQLTASQTSIPNNGGTTVISGTVDVSQTTENQNIPGQINILGQTIGLIDTEINASGMSGGGMIRIGGDYRGDNTLPQANRTIIDSNSNIIADALQTGNGGDIIIWSQDLTQFSGNISAQSSMGNGGFVEISSKGNLGVNGTVNLQGINDSLGTLLLDPRNITIVDANDPVETQNPLIEDQLLVGESSNNYTLSERTLESLGETADVILEAENNIEIQDLGDNVLNLQATTGSVTFTADADGDGSGSFSMNLEDTIQTNGGSLTINGVGIRTGNIITQGGEISLQSTGNGNLTTSDLSTAHLSNPSGNIALTTEQGSIRTGNLTTESLTESGEILVESGNNIQLRELSTQASDPIFGQGGQVTVEGVNNIELNSINTEGGFTGGEVTISSQRGNINFATRSAFSINSSSVNGAGGDVEIITSERLNMGLIESRGQQTGGNILLVAEVQLTVGEILTGELNPSASATEIKLQELLEPHSNIFLSSDEINLTGNLTGSGILRLQPATDAQNIVLGGIDDDFSLTQNLTAAELSQIQDGFTRIIIGGLESRGSLTIAGDITFQDPLLLRSPQGRILTEDNSFIITGIDDASLTLEAGEEINIGNLTTAGESISLTSQFGQITTGVLQSLSENPNSPATDASIRLVGREINFSAGSRSIQGQGELILQPSSNSQAIRLGDNIETDALDLSGSDLDAIADGFEQITIGRPRSNSSISWVDDISFSDPVLLQVPQGEGSIFGNGNIQGVDNASITLNAAAEIDLDRIITADSEIKITSINGNVSTGNLLATDTVEINAEENIITANITADQAISLSSSIGQITTGNLQITPNNQLNAAIRIESLRNITTQEIQTTVPNGSGGDILLNSEIGTIQTGNLNSSGLNLGGDISLQAGNQIKTGEITANSQTQIGGEVRLSSPQDIEVTSIRTEGQQQGGNIEIITDQFFRATGSFTAANQQQASLSVLGNETAGTVILQQGGDTTNTPFVIGDATLNGTVAPILEDINTPQPPAIPPSDSGNQNSPSDPSNGENDNPENPNINPENTPNNPPTTEEVIPPETSTDPILETDFENNSSTEIIENGTQEFEPNSQTEENQEFAVLVEPKTITTDQIYQSPVMSSVLQIDYSHGQEFVDYLGNQTHKNLTSHQSIDQTLNEITRLTGYKPAILYVSVQKNQLEIRLLLPDGQPIFKRINIQQQELLEVARTFTNQIRVPRNFNNKDYLHTGKQLYDWLISPIEAELKAQGIKTLIFSMDSGLRTIPIAALYDGEQFLLEKYSLGLIPSLSLTDTSYVNLKQSKVLAMGASNFSDPTQQPLPAVPLELNLIVEQNRWPGQLFLNEEFTVENLKNQRHQQQYEIIHLATHGEFLAGGAEQSYIQFWDRKLGLNELRSLKLNQPPVELLVLSACTTAVGDEKAELGFAGLAVQAGVKSALASLWYVSDAGTLGLMTTFYQALLNTPIKAEALRQAQLAMLNGQVRLDNGLLIHNETVIELPPEIAQRNHGDLSHPFYWAGFTMIGSPW